MQTIPAKTIVTRTRSRWWFGTDYNMNLYRGCTHGCIYCDSRSSCYHNPDFDHIAVKENALAIVRDDLRRKVQRGVVATGAMSDPITRWSESSGSPAMPWSCSRPMDSAWQWIPRATW